MTRIGSLFLFLTAFPAAADDFFEKRIRPVLAEKCYGCHSSSLREPKAGLRLDAPAPAVVNPGNPAGSKLLRAISYTDFNLRMPPGGKLPDSVIADFRDWIRNGAPDPRPAAVSPSAKSLDLDRGRNFWAFQPLKSTAESIDALLASKRAAKGLAAAPDSERRAWLRRVTFDLTGLPPTPAEIAAFLSGQSHQQVIDRLLASPRYGERWARHWLDLVRFAETNGHEYDNSKIDSWRYRDYVIRAFNADLPFDQFVREHIAGDLLPNPRLSARGDFVESPIATNFYWFGEVLNSAVDSVKSKADTVDNQIDVLGKAFLGMTVACARCHDHKFDPIPTRDYYGLAGIMHSTGMREVVIDSPATAKSIRAAHLAAPAIARNPGKARIQLRPGESIFEDFDDLSRNAWHASGEAFAQGAANGVVDSAGRGVNELVGSLLSRKFRMPNHYVHIRLRGTKADKAAKELEPIRLTLIADEFKSLHFLPTGKADWEWATFRMTLPFGRLCSFELVDRSRTGNIAVDAIVFSELKDPPPVTVDAPSEWAEPSAAAAVPESAFGMVAWDEAPGSVKLHIRGNHQNLGEDVPRHFLQVLSKDGEHPAITGSGRLQLASWMTTEARHLLARVFVNRVWKHHFGEGLVRSADNFGLTGERPVHRELLDSLAARFIAGGWSVKRLHREILSTAAYRMASKPDPAALKADPRNELLHYVPVRRLEAEAIRDSILAVSGSLNETMYGPSITPHISAYQNGRGKPPSGPLDGDGRRGIYIQVRRNFLTPFFLAFDYPLPISSMGVRHRSTVPAQALMLMNNEFVLGQASRWAASLANLAPEQKVAEMYLRAFARPPEPWEQKEAEMFLAGGGALDGLAHVLFNSPEFIYVQ